MPTSLQPAVLKDIYNPSDMIVPDLMSILSNDIPIKREA